MQHINGGVRCAVERGKWKSDYLKSVVICTSCFWGRYSEMRERKWFDWFGVHCTRTLDWRRRTGSRSFGVQVAFKQSAEKSQMCLNVTEAYSTVAVRHMFLGHK